MAIQGNLVAVTVVIGQVEVTVFPLVSGIALLGRFFV